MNRSSLFVAVVLVILAASLIFTPPLMAQAKPADPAAGPARDKKLSQASKEADPGGPAPVIFFPEPLHDFGTIARGSKVSHNFKVFNNGDAPLRLIKAKGS